MADLMITLLGPQNEVLKHVSLPMPEGFEWEAETANLIDFTEKGQVFLVAGLQINARNEQSPEESA